VNKDHLQAYKYSWRICGPFDERNFLRFLYACEVSAARGYLDEVGGNGDADVIVSMELRQGGEELEIPQDTWWDLGDESRFPDDIRWDMPQDGSVVLHISIELRPY
jgi:hypothetical protein